MMIMMMIDTVALLSFYISRGFSFSIHRTSTVFCSGAYDHSNSSFSILHRWVLFFFPLVDDLIENDLNRFATLKIIIFKLLLANECEKKQQIIVSDSRHHRIVDNRIV